MEDIVLMQVRKLSLYYKNEFGNEALNIKTKIPDLQKVYFLRGQF